MVRYGRKIVFLLIFVIGVLNTQAQIITTVDSTNCFDINGMAYDKKYNNLYFVSGLGDQVLCMDSNYVTHLVAGTGIIGFSGDGGPATNAKINVPAGITVDSNGNVYFADAYNQRIRKIDLSTGIISTFAGSGPVGVSAGGFSGDGGAATNAKLNVPEGIAFDNLGNLYVADGNNYRIRKINPAGIISTIVGNGLQGLKVGDGGPATAARCYPVDLVVDNAGNLFFTQPLSTIRKVNSSGIISTIAGDTVSFVYNGDNIPATSANIDPYYISISNENLLFISDARTNNRIRMIDASGIIHTVAGNGTGSTSGDNGPATASEIAGPSGIAFDHCGNLYIGQVGNPRIRKVAYNPTPCPHLDVKETKEPQTLTIYPNPAENELHVDNVKATTEYRLLNITGIIEQSGTLKQGNNSISVQYLPAGVYVLVMAGESGERVVRRVVVE